MIRRLFVAAVVAIALAFVGGSAASPPTFFPTAWDFVDTGLCGYPIHSVGTAQTADHFNLNDLREIFTGPVSITTTNLLTGKSLHFQANFPGAIDYTAGTLTYTGQILGFGAGLPFGQLGGEEVIDLNTGRILFRSGTAAGIDLCRALSPGTVFFAPSTAPPPWGLPTAPLAGVYADNRIPIIGGLAEHVHVHLDVFVNGSQVTVPAGVGIVDPVPGGPENLFSAVSIYSPLHTHDDSGVLHVEDELPPFALTLGNFFDVWQVRLSGGCLGASCTGLRAWVNGVEWTGDPRSIPLNHGGDEIVLATGPSYPSPIPSSYAFSIPPVIIPPPSG